jgi:hypothetical protein
MAEERDTPSSEGDYPGKGKPSTFVNQFWVLVSPGLTKLSLGEQVFTELPTYSATFTLPTEVAREMAETILRLIDTSRPKEQTSGEDQNGPSTTAKP